MSTQPRTFEFKPAIRDRVSLIIMIAGASGAGKTLSALKIARGLAGGDDNKIAVIDTEAGRALHYAPARGEMPGPDRFAFRHVDLEPPFSPEAYSEPIRAADKAGFEVIVVDSGSHLWEGEGGLYDMHDAAVAEAVERARAEHRESWGPFNEAKVADKASVGAWREPKARNKRFVNRLLQCRAHIIICLRADEKMRMEQIEEKGRDGKTYKKTVIVQPKDMKPEERWVPICEKRLPYEATISLILTPQAPGIPIPIKLQAQHRHAVSLDRQISEETGRALAEWARGGSAKIRTTDADSPNPLSIRVEVSQDGKRQYVSWGKSFVDAVSAATSIADIEAIEDANEAVIAEIRDNPRGAELYQRILKAAHDAKAQFDGGGDDLAEQEDAVPDQFTMAAE